MEYLIFTIKNQKGYINSHNKGKKRFYLRKPREHFKARAFTIVETACKLCDDGRDVTIWTTSYEVQNLAREQRMKSLKIIKF